MKIQDIDRITHIVCADEKELTAILLLCEHAGLNRFDPKEYPHSVAPVIIIWNDGTYQQSAGRENTVFVKAPASDFLSEYTNGLPETKPWHIDTHVMD